MLVRQQGMNNRQSAGRGLLQTTVFIYLYGTVLGLFALAWEALFRDGLPELEWWQYLLAPLGIGIVAFALEGATELITRGDNVKSPTWKRSVRLLFLFLFLIVVILGPAFYKIGH